MENTEIITKPKISGESQAFNISVRGWIALLVVTTICVMSLLSREIKEPLYTLGGMIVGYYYAQKKQEGSK